MLQEFEVQKNKLVEAVEVTKKSVQQKDIELQRLRDEVGKSGSLANTESFKCV